MQEPTLAASFQTRNTALGSRKFRTLQLRSCFPLSKLSFSSVASAGSFYSGLHPPGPKRVLSASWLPWRGCWANVLEGVLSWDGWFPKITDFDSLEIDCSPNKVSVFVAFLFPTNKYPTGSSTREGEFVLIAWFEDTVHCWEKGDIVTGTKNKAAYSQLGR